MSGVDQRVQVGRLVFGIVLLIAGTMWLLITLDVVDLAWQVALAVGLILVGVAVLAVGRHGGLVTLGVVLTVVLGLASMVNVPLEGGIGERTYRPASASTLRDEYRLAMGKMELDLTAIDAAELSGTIIASVGMGELQVILPAGLSATLVGEAGAGELVLLGTREGGVGVEETIEIGDGAGLRIEVSVGLGKVEVRDAA